MDILKGHTVNTETHIESLKMLPDKFTIFHANNKEVVEYSVCVCMPVAIQYIFNEYLNNGNVSIEANCHTCACIYNTFVVSLFGE